jgi:hypothetical protein
MVSRRCPASKSTVCTNHGAAMPTAVGRKEMICIYIRNQEVADKQLNPLRSSCLHEESLVPLGWGPRLRGCLRSALRSSFSVISGYRSFAMRRCSLLGRSVRKIASRTSSIVAGGPSVATLSISGPPVVIPTESRLWTRLCAPIFNACTCAGAGATVKDLGWTFAGDGGFRFGIGPSPSACRRQNRIRRNAEARCSTADFAGLEAGP